MGTIHYSNSMQPASLVWTETSFPRDCSGTAHVTILLVYPKFLRRKPVFDVTFVPSDRTPFPLDNDAIAWIRNIFKYFETHSTPESKNS